MHKKLISYIVPCYNVAPYIEQCVASILCQTYHETEVILVDDGSTDATPSLCDKLATTDARIRVIHQSNQGLSGARNTGLMAAKGAYVLFLDADDFWTDSEALQRLVNAMADDIDMIGFNCRYYYPQSNTYRPWCGYEERLAVPISLQEAFESFVDHGTMPMSACLKMIKRSFLLDHHILFPVGRIGEDIPWFLEVVEHNPQCIFMNEYIYAYRQNVSTSLTRCNISRSFEHLWTTVVEQCTQVTFRPLPISTQQAMFSFLAYEYCILLAEVWQTQAPKNNWLALREYAYLLQYTRHPKVRMAHRVYRLFGLRLTSWVLYLYNQFRQRHL